jgi:hypothetical protein
MSPPLSNMIENVGSVILFKVGQKICFDVILNRELEMVDKDHEKVTKFQVP